MILVNRLLLYTICCLGSTFGWADQPGRDLQFDRVNRLYDKSAVVIPGEAEYKDGLTLLNKKDGKNSLAAMIKFRAADAKGYSLATYKLGSLLTFGTEGIPPSPQEGLNFLQLAGAAGLDQALFTLGKMIGDGRGFQPHPMLALCLLRLAREGGIPQAKGAIQLLKNKPNQVEIEKTPWVDLEECDWIKPFPSTSLPDEWSKGTFSGAIAIQLEVNIQGKVTSAVRIFGSPEMEPVAIAITKNINFKPKLFQGVPTAFKTIIAIKLNDIISSTFNVTTETIQVMPKGAVPR